MSPVLLDNEDLVLGYASGKIQICFIRILLRDRVKMEVSRYDLTKENVLYRLHNNIDYTTTIRMIREFFQLQQSFHRDTIQDLKKKFFFFSKKHVCIFKIKE